MHANFCWRFQLKTSLSQPNSSQPARAEYDRLIEQSPCITDDIISTFKSRFKDYEVAKPSICNGLDRCDIFKVPSEPEPEPEV
jgi:hypothetical protein